MNAFAANLASNSARLLDICLRKGGYVLAVIEAYFDESGTGEESPFLCVAGYLFEKERAKELEVKWEAMLAQYGVPYFHMVECAHNIQKFSHLSKSDCDLIARQAIAYTKEYAIHGIAMSLDKTVYDLIDDKLYKNPYAFLCAQLLEATKAWCEKNNHHEPIAYFYEGGGHGFSSFNAVIERIKKDPAMQTLRKEYRIDSVALVSKESSAEVQCADILAWQIRTHRRRRSEGLPRRKDFIALVDRRNIDYRHYEETAIRQWLANSKGMPQTSEGGNTMTNSQDDDENWAADYRHNLEKEKRQESQKKWTIAIVVLVGLAAISVFLFAVLPPPLNYFSFLVFALWWGFINEKK